MQDNVEFTTFVKAAERRWQEETGRITIFIGENGAGKSRLLSSIEESSMHGGVTTIAIANTPYDKFRTPGHGSYRLLNRQGASGPHKALKLAIANAIENDELSLRKISRILRHCGFLPDIGIRISLKNDPIRYTRTGDIAEGLEPKDANEVTAICNVLLRGDFPKGVIWFDFDSGYSDYSFRSIIPKIFRWEKLLRRGKVISNISLYLRKSEQTISLAEASSGELSLVSTIAFLAGTLTENAIVLIDEPENSLHPRWQREYLSLLQDAVGYRDVRLFIATHSPLIVSSFFSEDRSHGSHALRTHMCILSRDNREDLIDASPSVEGILAEVFNTITPANHYLSEELVRLMDEVDASPGELQNAKDTIEKFKAAMPDEKQIKILDAVEEMLIDLAEGKE